ncbi:DNA methyltransferase [Aquirufa nivalisilvae]|uniref:DNA methyltransferase n=1 Tax=Aquirufa nivalisilvae TaxID=2516557 RepID=UPI0022A9BB2E|nr:DNA methyltransferase [Aquirufa nivalisilvae]MCZ2481285.1 ParB N-terminal domain-containing protein [Aquirufa nivalisilvae]
MKVKVSQLKHHPLNERIYSLSDINSLVESIKQVGLLESITIDQHNNCVSGNRRLESIKRLGWKEVDVHQINVKKGDEVLTLIHFNRQRIKTTQELINEYLELESYHKKKGLKKGLKIRNVVSKEIKVADGQLARILYIHKRNPEYISLIDKGILSVNQAYMNLRREEDDKKSRETIKEYSSHKISKKDLFKFYLKSSHIMKEVTSSSCDLVMCSPPFWRLRSYTDNDILGSESTSEEYVQNIVNHLSDEVMRILLPTGSFFIELGDTFLNGNLQNIPHRIAIEFQKRGFIQRNNIVVVRKNPKPSSSKKNLTPSYSFIFHFVKSMDYHYVLSLTKSSTNTKPSLPPRHRNLKGEVSLNVTPFLPNKEGRNMGDFFTEDIVRVAVSNQRYSGEIQNPAQYPEQLVHLILNSVVYLPFKNNSKYSPLCCDPFAGNLGLWKGIKWFNDNLDTKIRFVGYDIKKWF